MDKRRVVITGMGTVNPVGNSVAESWAAVKAGTCGIGPITRYDTSGMKVKLAGEVKNLDLDALLGKRDWTGKQNTRTAAGSFSPAASAALRRWARPTNGARSGAMTRSPPS